MIPIFYNRDFSAASQVRLRHSIGRLEWSQFGGPKYAQIDVSGPDLAIWQLTGYARRPVVIYGTGGERVWWGYVNEVLIRDGAFEIGISMDRVMNRVQVIYSEINENGDVIGEGETTWEEDSDSISEYGYREYIGKLNQATSDTAEAKRAILLDKYSVPNPISRALISSLMSSYSKQKSQITATLKCKGWWETLNWRYVSEPPIDGIYYQAWNDLLTQQMGRSTWKPVMQQFTVGARDVIVREVTLSVVRNGSPADNFVIGIYALNASGNPTGAALGTITVTGTDLSDAYKPTAATMITKAFSSGVNLTASTQYGLQLTRSGSPNAVNFYEIGVRGVNEYAGGIFKVYDHFSSSWTTRAGYVDMPFILHVDNEVGTARQINDLIDEYAEFIEGVFYEDTGLEQSNFQDGRTTCMEEILELMEMGGINGRQLLAKIDPNRYMTIYEEPDPDDDPEYLISQQGRVLYLTGNPVTTGLWRVPGSYARLKDAFPGIQPKGASGVGVQFIEEIHWTPRDGIRPIFRGQVRPEDLLKTEVT